MSPTVFIKKNYRFFFFSREEPRPHIHIIGGGGESKLWLVPEIELAKNHGFSRKQIKEIENIIEEYYHEILES